MTTGTTERIDVLQERYRSCSTSVIGLYEVARQALHEFDACVLDGRPKRLLTIGRARYSDIRLSDRSVSLVHCEIHRQKDEGYLLRDADSTNGTFVNDIKVERVLLAPGMWLFIGRSEMFVIGEDRKIPLRARTTTSFWRRAAYVYGSDRKAARQVGKSHTTIQRARKKRPAGPDTPGGSDQSGSAQPED